MTRSTAASVMISFSAVLEMTESSATQAKTHFTATTAMTGSTPAITSSRTISTVVQVKTLVDYSQTYFLAGDDQYGVGQNISLDDIANDGHIGEGDNVRSSIENIIGTYGADRITGSAANNKIAGLDGDDTIHGMDGNDTIKGGFGHDKLFGDSGDDLLIGLHGNKDTLDGGDGHEQRQPGRSGSRLEHRNSGLILREDTA